MLEETCCLEWNKFTTEDYFTTGFLITAMYKQMLITDNIKNAQLAETAWLGLRSVLIKQCHKNIDEKCKMLIKIIKWKYYCPKITPLSGVYIMAKKL